MKSKDYIKWLRSNLETVDLKYFGLDEMLELFCKQHEETKNDLQKRQNKAKH